jgi:ferredoxin
MKVNSEYLSSHVEVAGMIEAPKKNPLNVPGKYYVTDDCLFCEVCVDDAPNIFRLAGGMSHVYKQPETAEEERQCQEAMRTCCVEAIKDDG